MACLIHNGPRGYTLPDSADEVWGDLQEFVAEPGRGVFLHPVPSALYLECREEIEAKRRAEQVCFEYYIYSEYTASKVSSFFVFFQGHIM